MIELENSEFVKNSEATWILMKSGISKSVNAKIRENDKIVAKWDERGEATSTLLSLLENNSDAVKYAAAAYLMKYGGRDAAIPILRDLVDNSPGLISPAAAAVLRVYNA